MGKIDLYYQDSALGEITPKVRDLKDEEKKQINDVLETLQSPGYSILHGILVEEITNAEKMLWSRQTPLEDVRYYQGVVKAVQKIQNKFLSLSKEETYVGTGS